MKNPHPPTNELGRRSFIKGVATLAAGAGFVGTVHAKGPPEKPDDRPVIRNPLPTTLLPQPKITARRGTEGFWTQVRKSFVLAPGYIHLNTGTTGSQPLFSLNNLAAYNVRKSMDPRDWEANLNADQPDLFPLASGLFGPSAMTARQSWIAGLYGADPGEIVLSYNTTDACNLIFAGTPWNPGDRIVTTHLEHPALNGPMAWARDYHGVELKVVELPSNFTADITVAEVLALFEQELAQPLPAGAKQYLAVSEIFYKNGLRLPIAELCQLARGYGAFSIIDTAHGWGQLPIHCHDYGADFICGAGHKWLCGGPGTGICYIRQSGANLPPFAMGNFFLYGNPFQAPSFNYNKRTWQPAIYTQLRGEFNNPAVYAMTDVANYFKTIGIQDIHDRGVALGNHLKALVTARWGEAALWIQRNPDPAFATALTCFNPFAAKDDPAQYAAMNSALSTVVTALAAESPKIYVRTTTWRDRKTDPADNRVGLRLSTHGIYLNREMLEYAFGRLANAIDARGLVQLG